MSLTIGLDIGGTKLLGGVVGADGRIVETSRRPTPTDGAAVGRAVIEIIRELAGRHVVQAVGIAATGLVDAARSRVLFSSNLGWRDEPLREHVQRAVDVPVVVENDANAAAWAEFRFGAARDAGDSMVMVTVGTGIGGGIVLGGQLVRGAHGIAAELGHTLAVRDGHPCGCGRHGCLEQYASGNALARFAREAATADPKAAAELIRDADGDPAKITGPMVTAAAHAGDPVALGAFAQAGYWLGQGLADMVQMLDPEVIVVGGGVIDAGDLLLGPTRAAYAEALPQRGKLPVAEVVAASMGNTAGLVGASDLARR